MCTVAGSPSLQEPYLGKATAMICTLMKLLDPEHTLERSTLFGPALRSIGLVQVSFWQALKYNILLAHWHHHTNAGSRFYGTGSGAVATPGPNSYDLTASMPVLPRAPITKFGTAARDGKLHLQSSGVIYDLDNALKTTRPRSGRTKIGTAPRFPQDNKVSTTAASDSSIFRVDDSAA
jgi:hypothetical protein